MSSGAIIAGIEEAVTIGAEKVPICLPNPGVAGLPEMFKKVKIINAYLAFTGKWPPPEFMAALDQKYGTG